MRPAAIRATLVTVLLVLTVLLATLLMRQAIVADRDHRASAERVLSDYAALGADGAASRLQAALNSQFYPVLAAIADLRVESAASLEALRESAPASTRDVTSRLTRIARVDTVAGSVASAGAPLDAAAARVLVDSLRFAARALPAAAYTGLQLVAGTGDTVLLAYMPLRGRRTGFATLTMPLAGFADLVRDAVDAESAIPRSMSHGASVSGGVQLDITSPAGLLARHGAVSYGFHAARSLGPAHANLGVDVTVSEALAPVLLATNVSRLRTPLVITLFAAMATLIIAVGFQVRREQELVRLRDDFVASVSHELRTPLAQIRMFAETLRLERVRSPEERDRSLAIVENESRRLEHLVRNLLHFSNAERGTVAITRERADLSALIESVAHDYGPLAERAGATLAADVELGVIASIDPAALRQVLVNLIDNALKYGRPGQAVVLRLRRTGPALRIEVDNEGDPIPDADRARVWHRFYRGESARRGGVTGTGIGLAIVHDIVTMHYGTVAVETPAAGGTRVAITIPERAG